MIDWFVFLTPILLLAVVGLLRFVGCQALLNFDVETKPATVPPPPPPYKAQVLATPNLVAYWRLGDTPPFQTAKDEKGTNNGEYVQSVPLSTNPTYSHFSQGSLPLTVDRRAPGLLKTEPSQGAVNFQGGFVRVRDFWSTFKGFPSFTVEAWVLPDPWPSGSSSNPIVHSIVTLAEIDGAAQNGFSLLAQWEDGKTGFFWKASLGTGAAFPPALTSGDPVIPNKKTYVAMTYEGATSTLTLHVATGSILKTASTTFSYTAAQKSNLYIGMSNLTVSGSEDLYGPFAGWIQEVAVYNRALTIPELQAKDISGNM